MADGRLQLKSSKVSCLRMFDYVKCVCASECGCSSPIHTKAVGTDVNEGPGLWRGELAPKPLATVTLLASDPVL